MRKATLALCCAAPLMFLAGSQVLANPVDYYVLSPVVDAGDRDVETRLASVRNRDGTTESGANVAFGTTVFEHWAMELNLKWARQTAQGTRFDGVEWENRWQITEPGEYPVDLGWVTELEWPRDRTEGTELRFGPMLRSDFADHWQGSLNLLFGRHFDAAAHSEWNLDYQAQLLWRGAANAVDIGIQAFGSLGRPTHWAPASQQSHLIGPALFGSVKSAPHARINWNVGVLAGVGSGSPRSLIRSQVELEF
jgi:hypothetical protein